MSGDPEQEYFADGMVEDIITALSRIRWLFVIARNSSFTYKGRAVDIKQVGRELGVRYVLEGSVRGRATGADHRTAHRHRNRRSYLGRPYDGALSDVFDLQDRIAESVVGAIQPSILTAEMERSRESGRRAWSPMTMSCAPCRWCGHSTKSESEKAQTLA